MGFKLWIHYNKQILFSKAIVLLEGFTDQILLNHLISKLNHSAFGRNISFISVAVEKENGGKCRIPEFQKNISLLYLEALMQCDKFCLVVPVQMHISS